MRRVGWLPTAAHWTRYRRDLIFESSRPSNSAGGFVGTSQLQDNTSSQIFSYLWSAKERGAV
jgi:hypothetical protein